MNAKNVASFSVNHDTLLRGVYVSREDVVGGETLTTFDIRMKLANKEPVLGNSEIHTLEHLFAVYLRSEKSGWADKVIYIGPMGCRTGFYLIVTGEYSSENILPLVKGMFDASVKFGGDVPATTSIECGNYLEHNLEFAKFEARRFIDEVLDRIKIENLVYPD